MERMRSRERGGIHVCTAFGLVAFLLASCVEEPPSTKWDFNASSPPPAGDLIFPEKLPEDSSCMGEWCWLNPRPFPHIIDDLRSEDGQLRGVAPTAPGPDLPVILGDSIEIIDPRQHVDGRINDLVTSQEGWMALTRRTAKAPQIQVFNEESALQSIDLPDKPVNRLTAGSADNFVAFGSDSVAVVMHGGTLDTYEFPGPIRFQVKSWSNGEFWQIGPEAQLDTPSFDRWRSFPPPVPGDNVSAMGPSPASACAEQGVFVGAYDGRLLKWEETEDAWETVLQTELPTNVISCSPSGTLLAGTRKGRLHRRTVDGWNATKLSKWAIGSVTSHAGATYVADGSGTLFEIEGDNVTQVSSEFSVLNSPDTNRGRTKLKELWINEAESDAVLATSAGFSRRSTDGWSSMPESDSSYPGRKTQVWGIEQPRYAITSRKLWKWTGTEWTPASIDALQGDSPALVGLAGTSSNEAWLATRQDLFRFDGQRRNKASKEGTQLNQFLNSQDGQLEDLHSVDNGDYFLVNNSRLFRLRDTDRGWRLTDVGKAPCRRISDVLKHRNGALYITAGSSCVARRTDGEWQTLKPPEKLQQRFLGEELIRQPDGQPPLVAATTGVFSIQSDGTLDREYIGYFSDGAYLPKTGVTLIVHIHGILASYK